MKKLISIALCICLTLAAVFVVAPKATKVDAATETANELLTAYYNGGSYVKDTEIYAAGLGVGDEGNFHAKASASNRKTVYSKGNTVLYMTGADVKEGGYQDKNGKVERFHYDVNGQEVHDFWVEEESIKVWFTDLEEFKSAEWEQDDNVYTTTATEAWINFIAPMWEAYDLIEETVVTMQNTVEGLVLELYGNVGEAKNCKFAKATITIPVNNWNLVTDASELSVGDQIVIAGAENNYVMGADRGNNRGVVDAEKSGNTITLGEGTQIITLEAGTVDGTFAFNVGNAYLYAASSSSNQLKTKATKDDNGSWTITVENGVATIKATQSSNRNWLRINPTNNPPIFSAYASGQNDVSIYVASSTTETVPALCAHVNKTTTTVEADCTTAGSTTITCKDCEKTLSTEIIDALGHTTENGTCERCGEEIGGSTTPTTPQFVKVTSAQSDWSGTYLIVYEDGNVAFNGALSTLDATSNTVTVTISNGVIAYSEALEEASFTIAKSGSNYTIKSASGYYIGQSSNANGLKSSTSTTYNHTISINDDGTVNLISGGAYLRYNATSGQYRFRYYKSSSYTGQKAICLYKLVG